MISEYMRYMKWKHSREMELEYRREMKRGEMNPE